jgi:hypothetical protein
VDTPDNPYTTHTGEAEVEAINRIPLALRSFETLRTPFDPSRRRENIAPPQEALRAS